MSAPRSRTLARAPRVHRAPLHKSSRHHSPIFVSSMKNLSLVVFMTGGTRADRKNSKNRETRCAARSVSFPAEGRYRSNQARRIISRDAFPAEISDRSAGPNRLFAVPPLLPGSCSRLARWLRATNERTNVIARRDGIVIIPYTPKTNFVIRSAGRGCGAAMYCSGWTPTGAGKLLSAGSTSDVWHRYDCYLMRSTEFRVNCGSTACEW